MIKLFVRLLVVFSVISVSAACSHKYKVDAIETPGTLIPANSHFYIMLPKDGVYGATEYVGSSNMVVSAVASALLANSAEVTKATRVETMDQAYESAISASSDYIFQPVIVHWEDRATEWSGRPDRITMRYTIYDVEARKNVASTLARASSKWGTFGGDHPQDLVPGTVNTFLRAVIE